MYICSTECRHIDRFPAIHGKSRLHRITRKKYHAPHTYGTCTIITSKSISIYLPLIVRYRNRVAPEWWVSAWRAQHWWLSHCPFSLCASDGASLGHFVWNKIQWLPRTGTLSSQRSKRKIHRPNCSVPDRRCSYKNHVVFHWSCMWPVRATIYSVIWLIRPIPITIKSRSWWAFYNEISALWTHERRRNKKAIKLILNFHTSNA